MIQLDVLSIFKYLLFKQEVEVGSQKAYSFIYFHGFPKNI